MIKYLLAAVLAASSTVALAADITGAGATFPFPVYSKWSVEYAKETGNRVNYQSVGSGAGVKQIGAKTVQFGASDMPLSKEELDKAGLQQFPTVIGGVVIIVNLDIPAGKLTLTPELISDIFTGKIVSWNDKKIVAVNPDLVLPNLPILPVKRADASGTTYVFTEYLSKTVHGWQATTSATFGDNGVGAKGNEGVANNVTKLKGSIGYVEYAYVKQNKLNYTLLLNAAGKRVHPNKESFECAADSKLHEFNEENGFAVSLNNTAGEKCWPIVSATYILVYKEKSPVKEEVTKFFKWGLTKGREIAEELDFIPIPAMLLSEIERNW